MCNAQGHMGLKVIIKNKNKSGYYIFYIISFTIFFYTKGGRTDKQFQYCWLKRFNSYSVKYITVQFYIINNFTYNYSINS